MSNTNNGGPAFPVTESNGCNNGLPGMTLRQYAAIKLQVPDSGTDWLDEMIVQAKRDELAAKAMQGWAADSGLTVEYGSKWAYEMADAMLKAREKP